MLCFVSHSAPKHYYLAMHIFGLLTTAVNLGDLDDMVQSTAVVFSSTHSGANVLKHFSNLQSWLQRHSPTIGEISSSCLDADDMKVNSSCYSFHISIVS